MIALLVVLVSLAIVFFTLVKSGPTSSFRDGPFRQAGREVKRLRQEYEENEKKSGDQ